jgi:DNA-directed RNA polymerase specialized sigma24 family protein
MMSKNRKSKPRMSRRHAAAISAPSNGCTAPMPGGYSACACGSPTSARRRRTARKRLSWRLFEQRSQFASCLYRIAVNTALARRRRGGLQLVSAESHGAELERVAGDTDAAGPIDLEQAIGRLPQGARDVLVLVGLYGYSHDEAASQLGIAAGTSKAQLHRARSLLAAQLGMSAESV